MRHFQPNIVLCKTTYTPNNCFILSRVILKYNRWNAWDTLAFYHKLAYAKPEVKFNNNAVGNVTVKLNFKHFNWLKMKCFKNKKRLLRRRIPRFKSDLINNMDHIRIIIFWWMGKTDGSTHHALCTVFNCPPLPFTLWQVAYMRICMEVT